jgi:hypothetical protein
VNASIRNRSQHAEITVQVPLTQDLRKAIGALSAAIPDAEVFVSALNGAATLTVRTVADDERAAEERERELRLEAADALRAGGVIGG